VNAEAHLWRSELLGERRVLDVSGSAIECFERGAGPSLVFCHGWLANANLWRRVVDLLRSDFRCIALDLPLGSHRQPVDEAADLSPAGIGALVAEAVEELDVTEATLVGNDSGGAYSQIALAEYGDRIGHRIVGLVLTSCETPYDEWPPPPFDSLPAVARDEEALGELLGALENPAVRALPAAYGLLLKHPAEEEASDSYSLPAGRNAGVLHDVAKVMTSTSTEPVRRAGEKLIVESELPTLLVWSSEDEVFPLAHAERYAEALRDARLVRIDDAYSFTPEDRPDAVAAAIREFAS
jgi:pimeloyl-ACP methyl ester carboxylesterase